MLTVALAVVLIAATLPALVRRFYPPMPGDSPAGRPGAVVVLGGGRRPRGAGYALNTASLARLQVGVRETRRRGELPLLLSGGASVRAAIEQAESEAALMAAEANHWGIQARLILEPRSRNTWENAGNSASLLAREGIATVVLVTHRAHLPRAMLCFQAHGIQVIPVAVASIPDPAWLPSAAALSQVPVIWREWLALLWYHVRYRV